MRAVSTHLRNGLLDLTPALSGLIGKIALVSSFALVWAKELGIETPDFVFENVRLELLIGSLLTLLAALVFQNVAPAGTLAPLIVLIPAMAGFGVHPLVLGVLVAVFGIISVKTKVFERLIAVSGEMCKSSLALVFGISGVMLSLQKLIAFFGDRILPLVLLLVILASLYGLLFYCKKTWLIIPFAAAVSLALSWIFGIGLGVSTPVNPIALSPVYWWEQVWGIGFGFHMMTILKTLPFAFFVILLWTVDTVSVQAVISTGCDANDKKAEINLQRSFLLVSIRNLIGGLFGGAQTSSLWRSFLIPLYAMKRPLRNASILLGVLGVIAALTALPIRLLSYPPLVWSVLLFGIFIPFIYTGVRQFGSRFSVTNRVVVVLIAALGIFINPIITWLGAVFYEKLLCNRDRLKQAGK